MGPYQCMPDEILALCLQNPSHNPSLKNPVDTLGSSIRRCVSLGYPCPPSRDGYAGRILSMLSSQSGVTLFSREVQRREDRNGAQ